MNYVQLLESEMDASAHFTKENFGLQVGDGFPELVREVVKSEKLSARLMVGLVLGSLSGRDLAESMKSEVAGGQKPDMSKVILKNISAFDTPLAMLYWGIQIGRKMERESAAALSAFDRGE